MSVWNAVVRVGASEVKLGVTALGMSSRLGGEAWLDVEVERVPDVLSAANVGDSVKVNAGGLQVADFRLVGYAFGAEAGREVLRTVRQDAGLEAKGKDGVQSCGHWVVQQRQDKENVWPFLRRLASPLPFARTLLASDGWLRRLDTAFPVGCCFATPATLPPGARLTRALDSLVGRGGAVAGVVRTVAADDYRLAGAYVDAESAKLRQKLAAGYWSLPRCIGMKGCVVVEFRTREEEPTALALRLFDANRRSLTDKNENGHPVPVAPGTIVLNERLWFATGVTTTFQFEGGGPNTGHGGNNVVTRLELVDLSATALGRYQPQTTTLLGKVGGGEDPESPFMVAIEPVAGNLEDPLLQPLADWSLDYGSRDPSPLWACQASPGYVTASASAFYARWEPGDLVLFDVNDGGPAVIRGAPRRRLHAEAGICRGHGVVLAAGSTNDGPACVIEIGREGDAEIRGTVRVVGKMDVGPAAEKS